MGEHIYIILENDDGTHGLHFGEYYLDSENHILYIGIGDFEVTPIEGVTPVGEILITQNGTYNVKMFEYARVSVYGNAPEGSLTITENGIYNVVDKAMVNVQFSDLLKVDCTVEILP